jgi:hypothetical protein
MRFSNAQSSSAFNRVEPLPWRETMRVGSGIVGAACALKRQLPRAKLRTEARRGIRRAPTFTASIRPVLTNRRTVGALTSPSSACVALIEISSGSSAKRLACRSFTGLTSPNDLRFSRMVCNNHDTLNWSFVKLCRRSKTSCQAVRQVFPYATICNHMQPYTIPALPQLFLTMKQLTVSDLLEIDENNNNGNQP